MEQTNETAAGGTGRVPFVDASRRSCPASSHSDFGKRGKQRGGGDIIFSIVVKK